MKKYIGTKVVSAKPMTAKIAVMNGYNVGNNDGDGYEVEYKDGYKSWSPSNAFDESYSQIDDYDGQSGVFTSNGFKFVFVGGTKDIKSNIIYGVEEVTLNGEKMFGLFFTKSAVGPQKTSDLAEYPQKNVNKNIESFVYIPRTVAACDYLIEYAEWLRDNIKD